MRSPLVRILLLAIVSSLAFGCGKKDSPATPAGGGGATLEAFNSGTFTAGVFVHTFTNIGSFSYHCTVHGVVMSASVNVIAGAPDSATVNINNNSYSPNPQTVHQGGYIKWIANGSLHSVTRP